MHWYERDHDVCIEALFFFNDTTATEIYTLSLHDALPIFFIISSTFGFTVVQRRRDLALLRLVGGSRGQLRRLDRKSTRLNSSHANISYAVFCLKKKNTRRYSYTP